MKKTMSIILRSADDAKNLAAIAQNIFGAVTLSSGRYCVDAKSLLGIWVLDFTLPLKLEIDKWKEEYEAALEPYLF